MKSTKKHTQKRTFKEIRRILLRKLATGPKNINQLSDVAGVNWKTVDNHLIYFIGRGWAKEVYSSPKLRVYDITENGIHELGHR